MPYNEKLASRIREMIALTHKNVVEKKMFGGLCFMVNDKMCAGIQGDEVMLRLNPNIFETVIEKEGCRAMEFTGKEMKGLVYVDKDVLKTRSQLSYWIALALEYNKIAKASRNKKTGKLVIKI